MNDGEKISYFSVDKAGNAETPHTSAALQVDTTAPSASDDVPAYALGQSSWTVKLHSSDGGGSDVASIKYLVGTNPADPSVAANMPQTYNELSPPVLASGQRIRYYATDNAGNAQVPRTSAAFRTSVPANFFRSPAKTSISATGTSPFSVAIGDLDGDGRPDLVTANKTTNNVTVLKQNANGSFIPTAVSLDTGNSAPHMAAIADLDGDGLPDIATANETSNDVTVLKQGSGATFTASTAGSYDSGPLTVAIGDLDGDARPDIVTASSFGNFVTVRKQNADGSFTPGPAETSQGIAAVTGSRPVSVAIGDVNGDGRLDIVTANLSASSVTVLMQNDDGSGYYTPSTLGLGGSSSPVSVAIGDLDGDGLPDIATANSGSGDVTVLTQGSDGSFTPATAASTSFPTSLAIGDLNGDGRPDLAVSSQIFNRVNVLTQGSDGTYTPSIVPGTGSNPVSVAIGDLNNDGRPDIVTADNGANGVSVILAGIDTVAPSTADDVPAYANHTVTVTLTPTDDAGGSGIDSTYYEIGADPATPTTDSQMYDPDNKPQLGAGQKISYFSVDKAGNAEAPHSSAAVQVETVAPSTTDDVPADQVNHDVTVTLTATDNSGGSGVDKTYYTIGTSPATPTTGSTVYDPDHKPTLTNGQRISYFSVDNAGNAETPHTSEAAQVDTVAPGTTDDVPAGFVNHDVSVTLTATDNSGGSGVDKTYYTTGTDPAPPTTSDAVYDSNNKPTLTNGQRISYFSVDNAGNAETPHTSSAVQIDSVAPVSTDDVPGYALGRSSWTVTLHSSDVGGSNVASIKYLIGTNPADPSVPANMALTYNPMSPPVLASGQRIRYFATDGAGNAQVPRTSAAFRASLPANYWHSPVSAGPTGSGPWSVAIGDLSGDGRADIVTANVSSGDVTVLAQNNDGSFAASTAGSTGAGSHPDSVAIGDLNGDGRPDIAVANSGLHTVTVLTQGSGGSYTASTAGNTGSTPSSVVIGDLNGDGRPDLATANRYANNVTVLTQNSGGTFTAQTAGSTGDQPLSVAIGDLNGDGRPDLVTANNSSNHVTVLTQNNDGSFTASTAGSIGTGSASVAIGDLNGDGRLDIATANITDNDVTVLTQTTDGSFTASAAGSTGSAPVSVAIADLNGDGRPDIATADSESKRVTVLTQNTDGSYARSTTEDTGPSPFSVAVGDLNGDGRPDLVTANNGSNNVSVILAGYDTEAPSTTDDVPSVWLNHAVTVTLDPTDEAGGSGVDKTYYEIGANPTATTNSTVYNPASKPTLTNGQKISYFSVDKAGNPETVKTSAAAKVDTVAPSSTDNVPATYRTSAVTVTLTGSDAASGVASIKYLVGTAPADPSDPANSPLTYDPDHKPTLNDGEKIRYFATDVAGNAEAPHTSSAAIVRPVTNALSRTDAGDPGSAPVAALVTDLDGDGRPELIFANDTAPGSVTILKRGSDGSYTSSTWPTGDHPTQVLAAELNGDGKRDLVTANKSSITVLLAQSGGGYGRTDIATGDDPRIALADVAGDHSIDIVVSDSTGLYVLVNDGAGNFTKSVIDATLGGASAVSVHDLNGDGIPDIVLLKDGQLIVLLGDGAGGYTKTVVGGLPAGADKLAVGDLNGDGSLDIVVGSSTGKTVTGLINDGHGGFALSSIGTTAGTITGLATADLDGDGKDDPIVTTTDPNAVLVFYSNGSGGYVAKSIGTVDGAPRSVAVGDVNGDGRPDVVVGTDNGAEIFSAVHDTTAPSTTDDVDAAWHASDVSATLSADDGAGSGVASTKYLVYSGDTVPAKGDDGWATYSSPVSLSDGQRIAYYSIDEVDNEEDVQHSLAAKVDTTAPMTTDNVDADWHASNVSVTLTPDDGAGSGATQTFYNVYSGDSVPAKTDSGWNTYTAPVSLSNGQRIAYYSFDAVNNQEDVRHSLAAKVDTTAPSTTDNVDSDWHVTNVSVTLTATDTGGSGVDLTKYLVYAGDTLPAKTDDGWQDYTAPVSLSNGQRIAYYSVDEVDNGEDVQHSSAAKVDTTAPSTTDNADSDPHGSDVSVTLTADDGAGSGVASTKYLVYSGDTVPAKSDDGWQDYTGPVSLSDGEQVAYYSIDNVDNEEDVQSSASATVDTLAPTTTDNVDSSWHASVAATLTSGDGSGSGVASTKYLVYSGDTVPAKSDDGWATYSSPVSLSNGQRIAYYSIDNVDNEEDVQHSVPAKVDTTAPSTTDDVPATYRTSPITVTLSAADNAGSGVDKTYYEIGADPATPTTSSSVYDSGNKPTLSDGEKISYFSVDAVGNPETPKTSRAAIVLPATNGAGRSDAGNPGGSPAASLIADLDGDGRADIAFANSTDPGAVTILTQRSDGGFDRSTAGPTGPHPTQILTADINGDGHADLITANDSSVTVLTALTGGGYSAREIATGSSPHIAVGDVEKDGDQDIVVADSNGVSILRNDGRGNLTSEVIDASITAARAIALVDVDGDGLLDIVVLQAGKLVILTQHADGSFSRSEVTGLPDDARTLAVGDVDGDGHPDFVVGGFKQVYVVTNDPGGVGFTVSLIGTTDGNIVAVGAADMDGDGKDDPIVTTTNPDRVIVFFRNTTGAGFTAKAIGTPEGVPTSLAVGDIDGDGRPDLLTGTANGHADVFRAVHDADAPVTTDDVPTSGSSAPVTVTLTPTDSGGSGLDKTYYEIGASPATPTTASTVYDPAHKPKLAAGQKITYFSTDTAGNAETPHSSATVGAAAPSEGSPAGPPPSAAPPARDTTPPASHDGAPSQQSAGSSTGAQPVARRSVVGQDGFVGVPISCPAAATTHCKGTVELRRVLRNGTYLVIGQVKFDVGPGRSAIARIELTKLGQRLVAERGRRRLQVDAVAVGIDLAGRRTEVKLWTLILGVSPRRAPSRVTQTSRLRHRHGRETLLARGRVRAPNGMSDACRNGRVRLTVKRGSETLKTKTVEVGSDCAFRAVLKLPGHHRHFRVKATFLGTLTLRPRNSRTQKI